MPRGYSIHTIQLVLDAPPKWVDNVLAHHDVPGITRAGRGLGRRVPPNALLLLGVAFELTKQVPMPIGAAIRAAAALCEAPDREYQLGSAVTLRVDVPAIERRLERRLLEAVDIAGVRRRGRPPSRRKRHE